MIVSNVIVNENKVLTGTIDNTVISGKEVLLFNPKLLNGNILIQSPLTVKGYKVYYENKWLDVKFDKIINSKEYESHGIDGEKLKTFSGFTYPMLEIVMCKIKYQDWLSTKRNITYQYELVMLKESLLSMLREETNND